MQRQHMGPLQLHGLGNWVRWSRRQETGKKISHRLRVRAPSPSVRSPQECKVSHTFVNNHEVYS